MVLWAWRWWVLVGLISKHACLIIIYFIRNNYSSKHHSTKDLTLPALISHHLHQLTIIDGDALVWLIKWYSNIKLLHLLGLVALEKLFIKFTRFKETDGEGIEDTDPILLKAYLSFFNGLDFIAGGFYIYFGTGSNSPFLPFINYILLISKMKQGSKDSMDSSFTFFIFIGFSSSKHSYIYNLSI